MIDEKAKKIIQDGSVKIRVWRTGMLQLQTFTVKRVRIGQQEFVELFLPSFWTGASSRRSRTKWACP